MISSSKLFLTLFTPILIIITILYISVIDIGKDMQLKEAKKSLEENFTIVSKIINFNNLEESETILDTVAKSTAIRMTIINPVGNVLYDSAIDINNLSLLDNHALREEVRNATESTGYSTVRKSISTGVETIYFAKKLDNNFTLRLAYNTVYLSDLSAENFKNLTVAFIFLLIVLMIVFIIIANKISAPIKQLNFISKKLEEGKEISSIAEFNDKTLNRIASIIYHINIGLKKQNKTLDKEYAKLESIIAMMHEGIILITHDGEIIKFNESAKNLLAIDLKLGQNLFLDINDIKLISFFADIKKNSAENSTRLNLGDRVINRYVKDMAGEVLIVLTEITEVANYANYKNALLSNITHELKTPLSLIIGASETIINDKNIDPGQQNRFLEQINKHAIRLNNIIDDAIELYRLESEGRFNLIDKPTDIDELFTEIKMLNDNDITKHELIISCSLKSVNIRFTDIFSILVNLINNAKKYANGMQIFINIERISESKISIKVEDSNGNIIPLEERERIFERFYTLSKSRAKDRSGTGLGLAIVKHITLQYFGKILVYENKYKGNTFEVILKEKNAKEVL